MLVALLVTALFVIVALVIDMSIVRLNRQDDKSAADFAAAAGIRGLDDGSGYVKVWKGICAARDYLVANHDELTPLTPVDASGSAIADPCSSPPNTICGEPATWGTFTGLADGGRIKVIIKNGYDFATSGFAEDSGEYAGDVGDGPCDNLAVIIQERERAAFGGVAGASAYDTTMRSVGRLVQGEEGDTVAALVLLEPYDCQVLTTGGTGNTTVHIYGNGRSPGVIHADSLGNGLYCNKPIFNVDGDVDAPRIATFRAEDEDPETGLIAPGLISARSLSGDPLAQPGNTSPGIDRVCAQLEDDDCLGAGGGDGPWPRGLVGRTRVDARYRQAVLHRQQRAYDFFSANGGWTAADAEAAGFAAHECSSSGPEYSDEKVFLYNCPNPGFPATGKTFTASVREVVIRGKFQLGGTVRFDGPTAIYVEGDRNGSSIPIGNGNALRVNDGGAADCSSRLDAAPQTKAEFVLWQGNLQVNGGLLRLCQTSLLLLDGSSTSCPVPTENGTWPPADNLCGGYVGGTGGVIDWTAPNLKNEPDDPPDETDYWNLEDLALWSETSASWRVAGNGGLHLAGIFFTPNANPFNLRGGGVIDLKDAQFITRKLAVGGGGVLGMKPEPHNSVLIPVLGGFALVR